MDDKNLPDNLERTPTRALTPELVGAERVRGALSVDVEDALFPRLITFLANQRSVATRREYRREIEGFARYVEMRFPTLKTHRDFEADHFIFYKAHLEGEKRRCSTATVSRALACLSAYFRFLATQREELPGGGKRPLMDRDLFYGIKRPRVENKKETAALSADQVGKLLSAIPLTTPSGLMHHAIVSLIFGTGRRSAAARLVRRGDIATENGHWVVRVTTKGGKKEKRVLLPQVHASIERYIAALEAAGVALSHNDYVFQAPPARARDGSAGQAISAQTLYQIVKKYCAAIGLSGSNVFRFCPHSARATYATNLIEAGVSLDDVQDDLGHASSNTTRKYVKKVRRIEDSPAYRLGYLK